MIVVRLSGGLGNQLFQYALGRYLALMTNTELVLEDSFYLDGSLNATHRTYELDKFAISARRTSQDERWALRSYTGPVWKRLRRMLPLPGPLRYVHEPIGKLVPSVRMSGDHVFIDGYWQSEIYFAGIEDILGIELQPLLPMSREDQNIVHQMSEVDAVSLHVRRGDYVSNKAANQMHGVCGIDYYYSAVQYLAKDLANPVFFIFSDDLNWVEANLQIDYPCVYVAHNPSAMAVHDLRLMSCANHHIIANSSFSWWGAWLNPSSAKRVVRPAKWYTGLPKAGEQTCPPSWIAL